MSWATSNRHDELPPGWAQLRRQALDRDGHRCRWKTDGQRCTAKATDVDHIRRRGPHELWNLQSLCGYHHDWKTNQESAEVRREQQAKLRFPDAYPKHPGLK